MLWPPPNAFGGRWLAVVRASGGVAVPAVVVSDLLLVISPLASSSMGRRRRVRRYEWAVVVFSRVRVLSRGLPPPRAPPTKDRYAHLGFYREEKGLPFGRATSPRSCVVSRVRPREDR